MAPKLTPEKFRQEGNSSHGKMQAMVFIMIKLEVMETVWQT